jgi:hypothetical protein
MAQNKLHAEVVTSEIIKFSETRGYKQAVDNVKNVMAKFDQIEQKQRCLRVRFLDWLSDKLLSWSKSVHEMSVKIDSPCVIKLPEKK